MSTGYETKKYLRGAQLFRIHVRQHVEARKTPFWRFVSSWASIAAEGHLKLREWLVLKSTTSLIVQRRVIWRRYSRNTANSVTFTSRAIASNKNPEGLLLFDSTRNAMLKTQWIPYMEQSSMDEKSECRWQNMEDLQNLISRVIVTETRTTAARDIVHVQGLRDAGKDFTLC